MQNKSKPKTTQQHKQISKSRQRSIDWIKHKFEKLGIKTKALWIAAGIIADNNIMPGKNQQNIYDILLVIGESERKKDYLENCKKHHMQPKKYLDEPVSRIVMR